jgi:hypothetical protein
LRVTVIFRVGLLKKHLCVREVAWSNIIAKRCQKFISKILHRSARIGRER